MSLVPKVSVGKILTILKSPEVIAVGSAALIAPLLEPHINGFIAKIPILGKHPFIALTVFAILLLLVAAKMKGVVRAVLIGVAGANFFIAVIPTVRGFAKKAGIS